MMRQLAAALLLVAGITVSAAHAQETRVGVLTNGVTEAWGALRAACAEPAAAQGLLMDFRMPSPATVEQQNALAEKMLQDGVKALAMAPVDPGAQKEFITALAGRIPLVLLGTDMPDSGRACFIGEDAKEAGRLMGELTKETLPPMVRVLVLATGGENAAEKLRLEGLTNSLTGGQYLVYEVVEDKGDKSMAVARASEALRKHPEVGGYFGVSPYHAGVLLNAARAEKRERLVSIIVYGDSPEARDGLATGGVFAMVRPNPADMAKKLAESLGALAKGAVPPGLPESRCYSVELLTEKTAKPRNMEDIANALQIPRVLEETKTVPRPSFE